VLDGAAGSSPLSRGALIGSTWKNVARRIIPAFAGSTRPASSYSASTQDHPRFRGEHPSGNNGHFTAHGSSPLSRGAPQTLRGKQNDTGIIPAFAGSTVAASGKGRSERDHPRFRGEHGTVFASQAIDQGSSPLSRGAPGRRPDRLGRSRIIPAFAGSTGPGSAGCARAGDHPRFRGEHLRRRHQTIGQIGSSPLSRGAPAGVGRAERVERIIPAFAGSTSVSAGHQSSSSDHPRFRGEHSTAPVR